MIGNAPSLVLLRKTALGTEQAANDKYERGRVERWTVKSIKESAKPTLGVLLSTVLYHKQHGLVGGNDGVFEFSSPLD